ncbi:hypothetical protein CJP72_02275 [Citrobacter sp. NCU1]|nr:hypothetical protein [Citrobacter sp. NCU1]
MAQAEFRAVREEIISGGCAHPFLLYSNYIAGLVTWLEALQGYSPAIGRMKVFIFIFVNEQHIPCV